MRDLRDVQGVDGDSEAQTVTFECFDRSGRFLGVFLDRSVPTGTWHQWLIPVPRLMSLASFNEMPRPCQVETVELRLALRMSGYVEARVERGTLEQLQQIHGFFSAGASEMTKQERRRETIRCLWRLVAICRFNLRKHDTRGLSVQ